MFIHNENLIQQKMVCVALAFGFVLCKHSLCTMLHGAKLLSHSYSRTDSARICRRFCLSLIYIRCSICAYTCFDLLAWKTKFYQSIFNHARCLGSMWPTRVGYKKQPSVGIIGERSFYTRMAQNGTYGTRNSNLLLQVIFNNFRLFFSSLKTVMRFWVFFVPICMEVKSCL